MKSEEIEIKKVKVTDLVHLCLEGIKSSSVFDPDSPLYSTVVNCSDKELLEHFFSPVGTILNGSIHGTIFNVSENPNDEPTLPGKWDYLGEHMGVNLWRRVK